MDQENFKEALLEVTSVLRQEPKHPDALILQGKIQNHMRVHLKQARSLLTFPIRHRHRARRNLKQTCVTQP